jgi:very-short-patch-repair endonuclease
MQHVKFRRQVPIGNWIVDFVAFDHHLIIEVDGGQHNESDRDKQRDADLAARGFRMVRFWNSDVLARSQSVLEQIMELIQQSPSPGFAPDGAPPPSPTRREGNKAVLRNA